MDELSDTLLNQLYKQNCPTRHEEDNDRYIIDVKAVANCSNGLRFACPLCLYRKGSEAGYKARGQPHTNSTALCHNHGGGVTAHAQTTAQHQQKILQHK